MKGRGKILELRDLSIGYRQVLVSGIRDEVKRGMFVALIGANGIGKSTLLKTISGIIPPLAGSVFLSGRSLRSLPVEALARMRSIVGSKEFPFGPFSVWDWVSAGRLPYTDWRGKISDRDREIIWKSIRRVGLQGYEYRMLERLSDGELQRVRIAKALAQQTDIILLDEPSVHLDLPGKMQLFGLLREISSEEGKVVVISTHELRRSLDVTDRLWVIDKQSHFKALNVEAQNEKEILGMLFGEME